jgi:adenylate cyclase
VGDTCRECGHELRAAARFCDGCGARNAADPAHAEYKQVTVLFADVVRSMDLAAAVGAERLREIMADLFDRSSAVVRRFGGTVDKFTGDGVMAVFGAPIALEDHAFRACLAALELQNAAGELGAEVELRDGIALKLRVGLNSGEVIAGEIGAGAATYTTVGEQVGLAQRMESVAPPGGVMVSESTAKLVEHSAVLEPPTLVRIKGATEPVTARRLVAARDSERGFRRMSPLIGRQWELSTVSGMLDLAIGGKGRVVGLVGPPGIGKSRMVWEVTSMAADRGVEVFTASCESHTSELPLYAVTRLLRNIFAVGGLDPGAARSGLRNRILDADPEDLLLLDDLLGIGDGDTPLPVIDPDARRRRLTVLLNTAAAARTSPAVYVIEDVHWIDEVSEAMLAELAAVVPQTRALLLLTSRPEYGGRLNRLPSSHRIAIAPLDDSDSSALAAELLGSDSSVVALIERIADGAAGNPFFAEEIIRDLAERGVVDGEPGAYVFRRAAADLRVPASLQATIAARIDRLNPKAKRTLNAAAVVGARFDADSLIDLVEDVDLAELITAELIDQVTFTGRGEYAFRHPMIRTVAYESQLKADRAQLHRRLAAAIQQSDPDAADQNAALVAQHLEAADDLVVAYQWHMRAGTWVQYRDIRAARVSWTRAKEIADRLPGDGQDVLAMRIGPRSLLAVTTFSVSGSVDDIQFDELRQLCASAGDNVALGIGMAGVVTALIFNNRFAEAARFASDSIAVVESIPDQGQTLGMWAAMANAKWQAGQVFEALTFAQRVIDLADGDPTKDNVIIGSPLAFALGMRGSCRFALGIPGWRDDFDLGIRTARGFDTTMRVATVMLKHRFAAGNGGLLPDAVADAETAEVLNVAERAGDDFSLDSARLTRGGLLVLRDGADRAEGIRLLELYRQASIDHGYTTTSVRFVDTESASELLRLGDVTGAIELARSSLEFLYESGDMGSRGPALTTLVEALLCRGTVHDVAEARASIERLAAVPVDPGFVLHELPLHRLRALLARADGDEAAYREHRDQYRTMATKLGFEGHIAIAEAMD